MSAPQSAKAICGFNLAAQPVGFLQPLFAGKAGDNQTYVQRLEQFDRVAGFEPVAWPEQGTIRFPDPLEASVGDEALWAFQFPDAPPLLLPWGRFRDAMNNRLDNPGLAARPLLCFDIVQTLGLEQRKPTAFLRAYNAYANVDRTAAERWRNRSILEPALKEVAHKLPPNADESLSTLRIRQSGSSFFVQIDDGGAAMRRELQAAFREIIDLHIAIFPSGSTMDIAPTRQRQDSVRRKPASVTVILVGKLSEGQLQLPFDHEQSIDIIGADQADRHFHNVDFSPVTLIVGMQKEWRHLIAVADQFESANPLLVPIASSTAALMRDMEFQARSRYPSISILAGMSLNSKGDPSTLLRPVVDMLTVEGERLPPVFDPHRLPARHNVLLRERIAKRVDEQEIACRLGTRALRAGVLPGTRADLFIDPDLSWPTHENWERVFEPLYAVKVRGPGEMPQRYGPRHAMLLAERREQPSSEWRHFMHEGAQRLLEMRGWHIKLHDSYLELSEENRRFSAVIVGAGDEIPAEEEGELRRPAFGRAALLVIHIEARRETLLIGNRGQYCHVTLSDIASMRPGTSWLWPIIRRQLIAPSRHPSLAALRLAASVAAEAIRLERVEIISSPPSMETLIRSLESPDCERFLDFLPDGITRREVLMKFRVRVDEETMDTTADAILRLAIENDGPTLVID